MFVLTSKVIARQDLVRFARLELPPAKDFLCMISLLPSMLCKSSPLGILPGNEMLKIFVAKEPHNLRQNIFSPRPNHSSTFN